MSNRPPVGFVCDPLRFQAKYWPHIQFYSEQKDIVYSVVGPRHAKRTIVPAAQKMGKDFVAAFCVVYFFLTRHPCRVVTTSAKDDHLAVLWGEIGNLVQTCVEPLTARQGGPLLLNLRDMTKVDPFKGGKEVCRLSYVRGMVAGPDTIAAMGGHHVARTGDGIPRTMLVADECSSVRDEMIDTASPWMDTFLGIGNTWPCDNFLKHSLKGRPGTDDAGGDVVDPVYPDRYYRKVIHIPANRSPNVLYGLELEKQGKPYDGKLVVPGVKPFDEYKRDLVTLRDSPDLKAVVLDAVFYEGADVLLFFKDVLDECERRADALVRGDVRDKATGFPVTRRAEGLGCDPAEGGDSTAFAAVDGYGIVSLESHKTPDTNRVPYLAIDFMQRHGVTPASAYRMCFDRGGGGKQHADALRAMGWPVTTVGFGEAPNEPVKPNSFTPFPNKLDVRESKFTFLNLRAEMYYALSLLMSRPERFGLPKRFSAVLRPQLEPLPRLFDGEGRLYLPPKTRKRGDKSKHKTVTELVGHSPDEADALVLAVQGMETAARKPVVGAF